LKLAHPARSKKIICSVTLQWLMTLKISAKILKK
jgi:hypothetical protein